MTLSKWAKVGLFVGLGWILLRTVRPKWYDDLMLRAFAADQYSDPQQAKVSKEQFEKAVDLAARAVLPLGWVLRVMETASGVTTEQALRKVSEKVLAMGPPPNTAPETLAAYKKQALAAGGVTS